MALGTLFGTMHSERDLGLLQESVIVHPAPPNLEIIPIGGADGAVDISEEPAGWVTFGQRLIEWVFSIEDGTEWPAVRTAVANAINGARCHITLDEDPEYYYDGRITVNDYKLDGRLRKITVSAKCQPYKLRQNGITVNKTIGPEYIRIELTNRGRRPEIPEIYTDIPARIDAWAPSEVSFDSVPYHWVRNPEFVIPPNGTAMLTVESSDSRTGRLSINYEEAQQ